MSACVAGRVVRFDQECILIPQSLPNKRSIMVTKSYSLPMWKRRTASSGSDDGEPLEESSPTFKVPVPSFIAKNSRSHSRGRGSDLAKPLSPCLVHRIPSSPDDIPRRQRRPSLPSTTDRLGKCLPTVPLRACCPDCVAATEKCLKEGDHWEEKFSRGARRRRSSSVSSDDFSMPTTSTSSMGFAAVAANRHGQMEATVISSSLLSITVDEVDKRRKSLEHLIENVTEEAAAEEGQFADFSSAILEEDEDQLFPLPSPRRTPSGSPAASLDNSPIPSPTPSPNGSRIRVGPSSSRDSLPLASSEEGLSKSLSRKGRCDKGLLMPQVSSPKSKPTITIPTPSPSHNRASSSPGFPPSAESHTSSPITIPAPRRATTSSPRARSVSSPVITNSPSSLRQHSSSPTKRRNPSFSPTSFFKDALKGVSSIGGSGPSIAL